MRCYHVGTPLFFIIILWNAQQCFPQIELGIKLGLIASFLYIVRNIEWD